MKYLLPRLALILCALLLSANVIADTYSFHHRGIPISNATKAEYMQLNAAFATNANGQSAAAREIYNRLLDNNPKLGMALIGKFFVANSTEEFNQYLISAKAMSDLSPGEDLIIDAFATFFERDSEQFLAITKQLVEKYPSSSWAWRLRANAFQVNKQTDLARKAFDKAMDTDKEDSVSYRLAADHYMFIAPKDFAKAQMFIEQAIEHDPANPMLFISLGDAYRAQSELNSAQLNYEVAATMSPQMSVAHVKQGHANTFIGNFDKARSNYDAAIATGESEDNMNFGIYRAYTYLYEGKPSLALEHMQAWINKVDSSDVSKATKLQAKLNVYNDMAMVALHNKMLSEAKENVMKHNAMVKTQLQSIAEQNFKHSRKAYSHFMSGMLALKSGDTEAAYEHANSIQALMEPMKTPRKHELYHEFMGHIEMANNNYKQALAHLEQANQDNMYVKYHIAKVSDKMGDKEKARGLYAEVNNYNFNNIEYALVRSEAGNFN